MTISRLQDFKVIKLLIYIPFIHEKKKNSSVIINAKLIIACTCYAV